jgi:hypothetical protein
MNRISALLERTEPMNGKHRKKERKAKIEGKPIFLDTLETVGQAAELIPTEDPRGKLEVGLAFKWHGLYYQPVSKGEKNGRPYVIMYLLVPRKSYRADTHDQILGEGRRILFDGRKRIMTSPIALATKEG